jgi:hypothetical protein
LGARKAALGAAASALDPAPQPNKAIDRIKS